MSPEVTSWKTEDGVPIQCRIWDPGNAENEVWIVHGLGEHSGRYFHLADKLVEAGFRVIIADQRGNGLSGGKRGHAASMDQLEADLSQTIHQTSNGLKGFIIGQSMGGLLVAKYLATADHQLSAAVLLSPMFRTTNPPPAIKVWLAHLMKYLYPSLTLKAGINVADLTSDPDKIDDYRMDGLAHQMISASLGASLLETGEAVLQRAEKVSVPILVTHGDLDKITCPEAAREFADNCKTAEFKLWEGKRHELHQETDNDQIIDQIIDWLKQHTTK